MIALAADFLMFRLDNGEAIPFSADMVSVELIGESARWFDEEFVCQAAKAVFHYFRHELRRQIVSVSEFTEALEKVLRGFQPSPPLAAETGWKTRVGECDLCCLAKESDHGCELFFFPRLRDALRQQLRQAPHILRFSGLRGCVKHLAGARNWSPRCQTLEEQIVTFLRQCLGA